MRNRAVVLFARTPEAEAKAKRLSGQSVALFESLIASWLRSASTIGATPVIACAPSDRGRFSMIAPAIGREYVDQFGRSFGDRLASAAEACRRFERVAIVGIDTNAFDLSAAFDALDDHDAVIAPAVDGGINMIAYREAPIELLRTFAPGDDSIAERCIGSFARVRVLPAASDIDAMQCDRSLPVFEASRKPPRSTRIIESLRAPPQ